MKYLVAILTMLAAPAVATACEPLGVCSAAVVQSHAVVQQQVIVPQAVAVQTFVPTVAVANVHAFAVPQVFVRNHCGVAVQNVRVRAVRQPRSVVRTRTVVRSR